MQCLFCCGVTSVWRPSDAALHALQSLFCWSLASDSIQISDALQVKYCPVKQDRRAWSAALENQLLFKKRNLWTFSCREIRSVVASPMICKGGPLFRHQCHCQWGSGVPAMPPDSSSAFSTSALLQYLHILHSGTICTLWGHCQLGLERVGIFLAPLTEVKGRDFQSKIWHHM